MNSRYLALFQSMPVFGGLDEESLDYLMATSEIKEIPQNQFLFHEGDKGDAMYIIQHGRVAVIKEWENQDYILAYLGKGDCVGEMELIDISTRSASVLAIEKTEVIRLPRKAIFSLYHKNLEQFTTIQMNMGREVSRRLRETDHRLFQEQVKNQRFKILTADFKIRRPTNVKS